MSELKPCPFCGSPCDECTNEGNEDGFLGCDNRKCAASGLAMTKEQWNTRHNERENQQLKAKLDEWSNRELLGETERCRFDAALTENALLKAELKACANYLKFKPQEGGKERNDCYNMAINQPTIQSLLK